MSTRNDIRQKVLDIMQWCDMRRIANMHGYVFPAACKNFRLLGFSLLDGWKGMTSFERSRKRRCFLLTLTFWPRGVLADSWWNRQYVRVDAKRHTSKSSRYNAMMRYSSYSLHARLRFSRCMHEHSTARFQSASRVKMRDCVSFRHYRRQN